MKKVYLLVMQTDNGVCPVGAFSTHEKAEALRMTGEIPVIEMDVDVMEKLPAGMKVYHVVTNLDGRPLHDNLVFSGDENVTVYNPGSIGMWKQEDDTYRGYVLAESGDGAIRAARELVENG